MEPTRKLSFKVIQKYFRFDIGSGVLVLTNQELVNDSRWHDLVARRNRRDGVLMVSGSTMFIMLQITKLSFLN